MILQRVAPSKRGNDINQINRSVKAFSFVYEGGPAKGGAPAGGKHVLISSCRKMISDRLRSF